MNDILATIGSISTSQVWGGLTIVLVSLITIVSVIIFCMAIVFIAVIARKVLGRDK